MTWTRPDCKSSRRSSRFPRGLAGSCLYMVGWVARNAQGSPPRSSRTSTAASSVRTLDPITSSSCSAASPGESRRTHGADFQEDVCAQPCARDRGRRRLAHPRSEGLPEAAHRRSRTVEARLRPSLDPRLPLPGTPLIRRYQGKDIIVHVRADGGFECAGRIYHSLSRAVTDAMDIAIQIPDDVGRALMVCGHSPDIIPLTCLSECGC